MFVIRNGQLVHRSQQAEIPEAAICRTANKTSAKGMENATS
jgi:hypothetical protein